MEPEIRFCTSADGTRISYTTYGRLDRAPVLMVSGWAFSQEVSWQTSPVKHFIERLAEGSGAIGYDRRGTGRSSRELRELSTELEVADIEAVLESAGVDVVDMFAYDSNPAIPFVAKNQERVRRLVLYGASLEPRPYDRVIPMVRNDWPLARRAIASVLYPQGPIELQKLWSNSVRDGMSQEAHLLYMEHDAKLDLRETARSIRVPTLVISDAKSHLAPREAEQAALLLPDVRMVSFAGEEHWYTDPDAMLVPVLDFLGHGPASPGQPGGGTAIIVFADIANSTELTELLGDTRFREIARSLEDELDRAINSNGGQAIEGKLLGDGVLATFRAAREAIACARAMQEVSQRAEMPLHIGIHAGDVIREQNNVYGGAVNIASRVAGEAAAGETLVSATVRDLARTSADVTFVDRGERELKGVSEPVRVFAVLAE